MLEFLQLVTCELLEIVYFQKEFQTLLKPLIPTLAPSLKAVIKENGEAIKSFEEGVEGEEEDDEEMPKLTFDLSSLAIKDKEEKTEENANATTQEPVASTENATPIPFNFNFNTSSVPTTATPNAALPKFDFGSPTSNSTPSVPKFDFGATTTTGTPFTAPSFNFAPTGGEVVKSEKSGSAGRGRGRGHTGPGTIDNALAVASTGRGRGGPGGRGRGRPGHRHNHDDCDDDCDEDDDDEDDEDDEDEDDMFGQEEEEDPMAREASACLSALAVVTEMYKCGSDNVLFAELLAQSLETANYLKSVPEYAVDTFEFLRAVADEKK
jgi:hypothetical protein